MLRSLYLLALFTALALIFTIYFAQISDSNFYDSGLENVKSVEVKNIVAYSLLKKIEKESELVLCDNFKFGVFTETFKEENMWVNVKGTPVHVFSSYYDDRLRPYNYIRIIAMVEGIWNENLYCQFMDKNQTFYITKSVITPIWSENWNKNDRNVYYDPVLISCRVPLNVVPVNVSLSPQPCKYNIVLNIPKKTHNAKKKFTVCVKALNFKKDILLRLIQWIEMNRILGAEQIVIYIEKVNSKVDKALRWYQKTNFVNVKHFKSIKSGKKNSNGDYVRAIWQKRKYEIIAYNDCFYSNLDSEYVIPLDIDEIIIPRNENSWRGLFKSLLIDTDSYASFSVRNAYYFDQKSLDSSKNEPFFFSSSIRSVLSASDESGKSFISTKNSFTIFNHYTLETLRPGVHKVFFIPVEMAQMNHYKNNCSVVILPECGKHISSQKVLDPLVNKYKDIFYPLYLNVTTYLRHVL